MQRKLPIWLRSLNGTPKHTRSTYFWTQNFAELAVEQVRTKKGRKTLEHQSWAKLATYISQVINGITKTYDVGQIKAELDALKKAIGELEKP